MKFFSIALLGVLFGSCLTVRAEEVDILEMARLRPLGMLVDGKPVEYGDPELAKAVAKFKDLPHPWIVPAMIALYEKKCTAYDALSSERPKDERTWAKRWRAESDQCGYLATVLASSRDPRAAVALEKSMEDRNFPGGVAPMEGLFYYFVEDIHRYRQLPPDPEIAGGFATTNIYPMMNRWVKEWWALNKADVTRLANNREQ